MQDFLMHYKLIASATFVIAILILRWAALRYLQGLPHDDEDAFTKRWMNAVRNGANLLMFIGVIVIWLSEIRYFALSIATFSVALIFATREFIQCLLGAFYQTSARVFTVGDWVKVNQHCGEVISNDWLTTKLLEVDIESSRYDYTGKTIVVPNNQFVSNPVYNLNFMRRYVAHSFSITRDSSTVNPVKAKAFIIEKAKAYCAPFEEVADRYADLIEKRLGIKLMTHEIDVRLTTTNMARSKYTITIFCPREQAILIEQRLTDSFIQFWYEEVDRIQAIKAEKAKETV